MVEVANTLAYYNNETITAVKSFIVLTPGDNLPSEMMGTKLSEGVSLRQGTLTGGDDAIPLTSLN
jgi:hypothetical protein